MNLLFSLLVNKPTVCRLLINRPFVATLLETDGLARWLQSGYLVGGCKVAGSYKLVGGGYIRINWSGVDIHA